MPITSLNLGGITFTFLELCPFTKRKIAEFTYLLPNFCCLNHIYAFLDDREPSSPDSQNNQNGANTPQTNGQDDSPPPSHSGKLHKGGGPLRHKKNKSKSRHK